ncbi:2Fe-2S iron-sulfur cluster binding domain-containing protein [Fictibacillus enclensis]|uniref:2Fe-2S iron-sulfur cluster-binding protein n=1 Tax=Fictibacillus enclensis TaxID=1017270 RepID=UPI00259FE5DB|nr:2Fe-2S iron-sulfur cluster binding domain-containing protein [Fictibacillus enclensis]MDM5196753.1 2Fe-2S iron-sulfur cluster binding domain-containing protein [Fictibacillus enclensis]
MFKIKVLDDMENESEYVCRESESLLDAARQQGFNISYACKGGGCGICKIKIEDGNFERQACSIDVLPDTERAMNYTLACKTYPKSDMKVLIRVSK